MTGESFYTCEKEIDFPDYIKYGVESPQRVKN